jgi:hypothetical protein
MASSSRRLEPAVRRPQPARRAGDVQQSRPTRDSLVAPEGYTEVSIACARQSQAPAHDRVGPVGTHDTPRRPMAIDHHAIASEYDVGDPAANQFGTARDRRVHQPSVEHPSWHDVGRSTQLRAQRAAGRAGGLQPTHGREPIEHMVHAQLAERCHSRRRQPIPATLSRGKVARSTSATQVAGSVASAASASAAPAGPAPTISRSNVGALTSLCFPGTCLDEQQLGALGLLDEVAGADDVLDVVDEAFLGEVVHVGGHAAGPEVSA